MARKSPSRIRLSLPAALSHSLRWTCPVDPALQFAPSPETCYRGFPARAQKVRTFTLFAADFRRR